MIGQKADNNWKESYFNYLTKRLDSGESKNIAVLETIAVLKKELIKKKAVKILDAGCFSGAMLNRILNGISPNERERVKAVGVDSDKEVMLRGSDKYKGIIFICGNIGKKLPLIGQFDIVLISNVLHELAPTKNLANRKKQIEKVFQGIVGLVAKGGKLIILDGYRPDTNKNITVCFNDKSDKDLYIEFSKRYRALKIKCATSGNEIRTNQVSLTAFLTKARYINEDYWEIESQQLYQYFSEKEFLKMFVKNRLKLIKSEPQYFAKDKIKGLFKRIKPDIPTPAKNILLIAVK